MRTLILIFLVGLISNICYTQADVKITEKQNVYNKKGDYYLYNKEYKKAIVYYNMAFQKDSEDFFSILKKAEAYSKLNLFPQAEECYRIVFESGRSLDNLYRLKYAYVLLANNKKEEFRQIMNKYIEIVEEEIEGENYLISSESRIKLYKDSTILLGKDTISFKIKYEAYRQRPRTSMRDDQINIWLSNDEEYNIPANNSGDYTFSFQPAENYKIIIQRENVEMDDLMNNKNLSSEQRKEAILKPKPIQKAEIIVPPGMKYQFSVGNSAISPQYKSTLKDKVKSYQDVGDNTISLTALARELQFSEGEVYSFRFVKDDKASVYKGKEISTLFVNNQAVNVFGQSFFILLPLKTESNFNVQTDLEFIDENLSPKKYTIVVDEGPVFEKELDSKWLISLAVNTDSLEKVLPINRLSAREISIIPGTEYILTLSKPDPRRRYDLEIIVPLTKGVKYNMGVLHQSDAEFKEALAEFITGREGLEPTNEEVIDLSILSKELEVKPGEDLSFHLQPAKQYGKKPSEIVEKKSTFILDGKIFEVPTTDKYSINIPFNIERKINFQTDLDYLEENFEAEDFNLRLDTISFTAEIAVDTTGYGNLKSSGWLSMSVNTDVIEEVEKQNQFRAMEVSIIPAKEYILTVSKEDAETGKEEEIIVPLLRKVKYDFTSNPESEEAYKETLKEFIAGREDLETIDGTVIDITLLSKELQIEEGDKVSFSLLPVKKLTKTPSTEPTAKSSLFLDNKVVEFTQIQKYTINMPLGEEQKVNMQTNIEYLQENYDPRAISIDVDTAEFFSEIEIDTTGLGDRIIRDIEIKDPVFDVIVINFELNEHILHPEAKKIIQESVIDELKKDNRLYVTIKGYTDALGDADYNYKLSKKRAESVNEYLKENGIGENRIRTFSFGESQALKEGLNWEDLSEEELRKHRKVEIVIYLPK